MKCKKCSCIFSPEEKEEILSLLAEGVKPDLICGDCIERIDEEFCESQNNFVIVIESK